MSTGMTSERKSPLHNIVRITPLAPPTIIPIGPFKLSTHPGHGSSHAGDTINIENEIEWNRRKKND